MTYPSTIISADRSRATALALGILCLLATTQIALLVRVIMKPDTGSKVQQVRPLALETPTASISPTTSSSAAPPVTTNPPPVIVSAPPPTMSPPAIGQLAPNPGQSGSPAQVTKVPSFGPPPIGSFEAPNMMPAVKPAAPRPLPPKTSALPEPKTPSLPDPKPSAKPADPAANMSLSEMIDLAKQVRGLGDMQGALEVLKRADLQFPSTPEVAAETALSYEQMGLTDKAVGIWRHLAGMDPAKSAGFADLAKRKLQAAPAGPATLSASTSSTGDFGPKSLSLGACIATRDPSTVNGEKVVLRVPILRQGNAAVDPTQVDIDVYFFDRVNGEKIAQTIADEPLSQWSAPPVDWSGVGEEPLEVSYFLPTLTPGEMATHGRRSYHGYVVRLYYQHKLQDVAAEPRDLLDFGARAPQSVPGGANPLLPPVSN